MDCVVDLGFNPIHQEDKREEIDLGGSINLCSKGIFV